MEEIDKILKKEVISKEEFNRFEELIKDVPEEQAMWLREAIALITID